MDYRSYGERVKGEVHGKMTTFDRVIFNRLYRNGDFIME